jgi:hypothetical protein
VQKVAPRDVGDPLDHAIVSPIDQQNLAHDSGRGSRHQRRKRCDGVLFDAFGGDNDAEHDASSRPRRWGKRRTVITLSQSNQRALAAFLGQG